MNVYLKETALKLRCGSSLLAKHFIGSWNLTRTTGWATHLLHLPGRLVSLEGGALSRTVLDLLRAARSQPAVVRPADAKPRQPEGEV